MNRHEWTVTILRVLAIWWIAWVVVGLPETFSWWALAQSSQPQNAMKWTGLRLEGMVVVLGVILAVLIWVFSRRLASWIWRGGPEVSEEPPFAPGALQTGLLSAAGLIVIGLALPGLVTNIALLYLEVWRHMTSPMFYEFPGIRVAGQVFQVVFGLWLFLRPGFFAGLVPRRWYLGQRGHDE